MPPRTIRVARECFAVAGVFRTSRDEKREVEVVTCTIEEAGAMGRGEGVPLRRFGTSASSVADQIASVISALESGAGRAELSRLLPAGPARSAVDCALWDLEAKRTGVPVWRLAGLRRPEPVVTSFTVSLDTPDEMGAVARQHAQRRVLKLKVGRDGVEERVRAVRAAAPKSRLLVDANEAWTAASCSRLLPRLAALGVELVEQPLPAGGDAALADFPHAVPVCADESCHDRTALPTLRDLYEVVNVKLDKAGGLTEALALARAARACGLDVLVGSMVGSSLAIAPALLVAQLARWADVDGALLLARDREPALAATADAIAPAPPGLWG